MKIKNRFHFCQNNKNIFIFISLILGNLSRFYQLLVYAPRFILGNISKYVYMFFYTGNSISHIIFCQFTIYLGNCLSGILRVASFPVHGCIMFHWSRIYNPSSPGRLRLCPISCYHKQCVTEMSPHIHVSLLLGKAP